MDQEDQLPQIVCDSCFLKLRAAKELKETSINSDSVLRSSLLKSNRVNIKLEDDLKTTELLSIKVEPMEILNMEYYENEEIAVKAPTAVKIKKRKKLYFKQFRELLQSRQLKIPYRYLISTATIRRVR